MIFPSGQVAYHAYIYIYIYIYIYVYIWYFIFILKEEKNDEKLQIVNPFSCNRAAMHE
jgi:hypothetical protein